MNSLRDKMNNWEARPPAHMWDRISRALDESEMNAAFPERLRSLEIAAPGQVWEGIVAKLDSPSAIEGNEVVPMLRNRLVWIRVAAAAAILLLAVWGTRNWWMPAGEAIDAPASLAVKPEPARPKPNNNLPAPGPHVFEADSMKSSLASTQKNNRRADLYAGSDLQYAATAANAEYADELSKAIYIFEDPAKNRAEKYVTLLTPEGSFIRVSKKWSHLLCCITGEEQNAVCDKQVKAWQDQMASSPVTPAPGNFMDLLDLVNSLSEGSSL